jgi:hypothetical protein
MKKEVEKNLILGPKGHLKLPAGIVRRLKLDRKRHVRVSLVEGAVTIRPVPDIMKLFGALRNDIAYDPNEKQKALEAMGRRTAERGL